MFQFIKKLFGGKREPEHLRRGRLGEEAAKRHLKSVGLKFLVANFKTKDSEIDLVFRDDDCLIFVEVLLVDGEVNEVRHIPNAFPLTKAKRHA